MRPLEERYALALFDVTFNEEQLRADFCLLTSVPELWGTLENPCVSSGEKRALLTRLLKGKTEPVLLNFYRLLSDRGRISLLPSILPRFHSLCLKRENVGEATVQSAHPLGLEDLSRLGDALCRLHGKSRMELHTEEDPSLLGGFVLKTEGITYDKSVRGMLRQLRSSLKER